MPRTSNRAICLDGPSCIAARARQGMSREALAEKSRGGLSVATIKRLESGASVYFDTARRLAALLDTPVSELVAKNEARPPAAHPDPDHAAASIALLPFDAIGSDPEIRWFADGLVEDLITRIGREWFPVISRGSTFRYVESDRDIPKLRAELGVDYVVEGSVRRSADTLRVTARLIDARTGVQLWANWYDRVYREVFSLQDELVSTIVSRLRSVIASREIGREPSRPPADLGAWELALQGSWHFHRNTRESNERAQRLFQRALATERALPFAWYGLAITHQRAILQQWADAASALRELKSVCREFARHFPDDSGFHIASAYAAIYSGERATAAARLRDAIELDPNAMTAYSLYGQTLAMEDRPDEAIEQFELALRLSPRDSNLWSVHLGIGLCHFVGERYDDMLRWAKASAEAQPDLPFALGAVAVAHIALGDEESGRKAIQSLLELAPGSTVRGFAVPVAATNRDIVARYVAALEKAGLPP